MSEELDKSGIEKTTESLDGEVSHEPLQTAEKTASREDDSRGEAEDEKKYKLLQKRLASLQKEFDQSCETAKPWLMAIM